MASDHYVFTGESMTETGTAQTQIVQSGPRNFKMSAPAVAPSASFTTKNTSTSEVATATFTPDANAKLFALDFDSVRTTANQLNYHTPKALDSAAKKLLTSSDFSTVKGWSPFWDAPTTLTFAAVQAYDSTLSIHDLVSLPVVLPVGSQTTLWTTYAPTNPGAAMRFSTVPNGISSHIPDGPQA